MIGFIRLTKSLFYIYIYIYIYIERERERERGYTHKIMYTEYIKICV